MPDSSRTKIKPGAARRPAPSSGPSLSRMKDSLGHGSKWIFSLLLGVIAITSVVFFAGGPFGNSNAPTESRTESDVVAKVDGADITRRELMNVVANVRRRQEMFGQSAGLADEPRVYADAIKALVQNRVEVATAKRSNVQVSDDAYNKKIDEMVKTHMTQIEGGYQSPKIFDEFLKNQGKTREDMGKQLREEMMEQARAQGVNLRDELTNELSTEEYRKTVEKGLTLPRAINYSQIVISSTPKPEPASKTKKKKDPKAAAKEAEKGKADAEAAAKTQADAILKQLQGGAEFGQLAQTVSSDTLTKAKKGAAGWAIPSSPMAQDFLKGADKAKVGQLLGPLKSYDGYHIIKITGEATKLPDTINPETDRALQQAADEAYQKQLEALVAKAKVTYEDPALAGAVAQSKPDKQSTQMALTQYRKAVARKGALKDEIAWVAFAAGQLLMTQNQPAEAMADFQKCVDASPTSAEGWMALGDAQYKLKQAKPALASYKKALEWGASNIRVLLQLQGQFRTLKDEADAKTAGQKLQEAARSGGGMGGMGGFPGMMGGMGGMMPGGMRPGGAPIQIQRGPSSPGGAPIQIQPGPSPAGGPGLPISGGMVHLGGTKGRGKVPVPASVGHAPPGLPGPPAGTAPVPAGPAPDGTTTGPAAPGGAIPAAATTDATAPGATTAATPASAPPAPAPAAPPAG